MTDREIVLTRLFDAPPLLEGVTTVTFAAQDGKTRLTLQTRAVAMVAAATRMLDGMEAGWTQSIDRFAAYVAQARS